jgi:hypothetical protein
VAQATASLLVWHAAPEHRGQVLAAMDATGVEDQVGQQGLGLPRPHGQGRTRLQPSLKPTEKVEMHPSHRALGRET